MAGLFNGMAGLLNDVFGSPVRYLPQGGAARDVLSVFREAPVELVEDDGHPVLSVGPTWSVPATLVPEVQRGDRIEPANGKTYEILNTASSGSPASDARVVCDLHEVWE